MDNFEQFTQKLMESFSAAGGEILAGLTNVIGALLILIIGWLITKVILFILRKALRFARIEKLTEKVNKMNLFGKSDFKIKVVDTILIFVKWILFLVFLIIAADVMEWDFVSKEIGTLLRYIPKLFSAIALFLIGIYIATFVRKAIKGVFDSFDLNGATIISSLVFYLMAILVTITALNQAGIDTTVITNNITIILGAFLLAIAIGLGLGSKDVIRDLLRTFYTRKNYELGDMVKINDIEGTIEAIDNITMTLNTTAGKVIIPIQEVIESRVEVLKK